MAGFDLSDEDLAAHPMSYADGLLKDRVVLITGGGSGIGRAAAWLAARLGARVIIAGRKIEKLDQVSEAIVARGLSCTRHPVNIRQRDTVEALFKAVSASHSVIDMLINSAGGQFPQPAIDFTQNGWKAVIETNLDGTFNMMQAAARIWRDAKKGGAIVNIVVSPRGLHQVAHTVAARAGVIAFSEAVAVEWAPLGIRVNCIAPGAVASEGHAVYSEKVRARHPETSPMRRLASTWEIAEACIYLAGPSGGYITGDTLYITGGSHLWGEVWAFDKPAYFREATRIVNEDEEMQSPMPTPQKEK
jgi:citronellol/citronellal dehydrogenase